MSSPLGRIAAKGYDYAAQFDDLVNVKDAVMSCGEIPG